MKQYQYNYIKCGVKDLVLDGTPYQWLNKCGEEGWEVCGFAATGGVFVWTLRKEVEPKTPHR